MTEVVAMTEIERDGCCTPSPYPWVAVALLNAPIPAAFGSMLTDAGAKVGMYGGIAILVLAGWIVCAKSVTIGRQLVLGGIVVAFSQLTPILQFYAGAMSIHLVDRSGLPGVKATKVEGPLGGILCTLLSGLILIGCAWLIGVFILRMESLFVGRSATIRSRTS